MIDEAVKRAEKYDTALAFTGLTDYVESEGCDRENMRLPENQLALMGALIKTGKTIRLLTKKRQVEKSIREFAKGIKRDAKLPLLSGGKGRYIMTKKRKMAVIFGSVDAFALIVAIVVVCWFARMRGRKKYDYTTQEIHVKYDGINLYGKALVPKSEPQAKCPTVIYAHGAESDYKADYTTLSHRRLCSNSVLPCVFD